MDKFQKGVFVEGAQKATMSEGGINIDNALAHVAQYGFDGTYNVKNDILYLSNLKTRGVYKHENSGYILILLYTGTYHALELSGLGDIKRYELSRGSDNTLSINQTRSFYALTKHTINNTLVLITKHTYSYQNATTIIDNIRTALNAKIIVNGVWYNVLFAEIMDGSSIKVYYLDADNSFVPDSQVLTNFVDIMSAY